MRTPILIVCSDLHLSHTAPASRMAEEDWYAAQGRVLDEIAHIQAGHNFVTVVIAGDVFDRWHCPPKLINFAIKAFDKIGRPYVIAGQHDLPYHRNEDVGDSALHTLHLADVIRLYGIGGGESVNLGATTAGFFGWGYTPQPPGRAHTLNVAFVHRYTWATGYSHPGAAPEDSATARLEEFKEWDVVFCGDNHRPFSLDCLVTGRKLINCGAAIRRKSDERVYGAHVYVLYSDGSVKTVPLSNSHEKWSVAEQAAPVTLPTKSIETLLGELATAATDKLDFPEALRLAANAPGVDANTRRVVLDSLGQRG